jgi:Uma2 family endonuclease
MEPAAQIPMTAEEYLEREERSLEKHELIHGEMVAMSGGSPKHNAISVNVSHALMNRLAARRCAVLSSDQRIHVEGTGLFTYADVPVTCDRPRFHPKHRDNFINPRVIVEVLSPSTEGYDRGAKFAHYQRISSLAEYVLVSQDEPRVDHYRRLETGQWILTVSEGASAVVVLPALGCEVPLAEIYENLDLYDPPPGEADAGS